jgi:transcriptional regulator
LSATWPGPNPDWHDLDGTEVLAIFSGPHAYISPTWYESENVVPTWNYVAVHAYGKCRLVDDDDGLTRILTAAVATFERSMPAPWSIDTTGEFFHRFVGAVVGFRIEIHGLQGKWKLNQNHSAERREKVMRTLEKSASEDAREIARLMATMLEM